MFLLLLIFVFNLFIAAALILPNTDSQSVGDLRAWHDLNSRWAMPFVAFYALLTDPFYRYFMEVSPHFPSAIIVMVFAMVAFFAKSHLVVAFATVVSCLAVGGLMIQMAIPQ